MALRAGKFGADQVVKADSLFGGLEGQSSVHLRRDSDNKFVAGARLRLYLVKTVDEAMEVLTALRAGERLLEGYFEKETVNYFVNGAGCNQAEAPEDF